MSDKLHTCVFGSSLYYWWVSGYTICNILTKSLHSMDQLHIGDQSYAKIKLTNFGLPQLIFSGVSAFSAPTPDGYTNRWQGFLDLVLSTDTRSSSSPTSVDPCIKYPSHRRIRLHTNDMSEPAQSLNINTPHNVYVVEELMRKSSPTRTGPKILRMTFLSNTLKAAVSVLNGLWFCNIKKHGEDKRLVEF